MDFKPGRNDEKIKEMFENFCIVNGELVRLDELQNWGYQDFINFMQKRIPTKLYKYFPNIEEEMNVNYSLEAIQDNTVHLSYPSVFDDIYDSDISVSFDTFERLRLIEYCRRCNVEADKSESVDVIEKKLLDKLNSFDNYIDAFDKSKCTEIEILSNDLFCRLLKLELENDGSIEDVMETEYSRCMKELKNTFKTTCFATSPYSQLMWGGIYANCHRGFCLEYTISKEAKYKILLENLFPLVYSKVRSNMEEEFIKQIDEYPTDETLKNVYIHGALRKSIDWSFQDEWRLLMLDGMPGMKESKVEFFPISKVYLGYRMNDEERDKIISICEKKGIDYVGVRKRHDIFEMEECDIKR